MDGEGDGDEDEDENEDMKGFDSEYEGEDTEAVEDADISNTDTDEKM